LGSGPAGFLGDPRPGPLTQNIYRFQADRGEMVTVTLKRDGVRGSEGEIAQLDLRQEGGVIVETRKGAVPFEFTATLPRAGNYEIEVIELPASATGGSPPFRGYYNLDATSSSGPELQLEPILK
jgi:hypothetical protein